MIRILHGRVTAMTPLWSDAVSIASVWPLHRNHLPRWQYSISTIHCSTPHNECVCYSYGIVDPRQKGKKAHPKGVQASVISLQPRPLRPRFIDSRRDDLVNSPTTRLHNRILHWSSTPYLWSNQESTPSSWFPNLRDKNGFELLK